ncbi:MAG: hypothetical protein GQ565_04120 [Candidatus Aegiribacteria sp.]|nr:hypothetical protein [Candidatus Aegiribacteria sp.]
MGSSATQTTWEGGEIEITGSFGWYDRFRLAWGIDWFSTPGSLLLTSGFAREPISFEQDFRVTSFLPFDIDSDGDVDLFLLQKIDNRIGWLENVADNSSWLYHNIQDPFYKPRIPAVSDFDDNGLNDLAVISDEDGLCISYQEEEDIWVTESIDRHFYIGSNLLCFDLNGDGLEDIIGRSHIIDEIHWWENPGTDDSEWVKHILDRVENTVLSMVIDDYNGDGSMEMYIVTSHSPHELRVHRFEENEYTQSRLDLSSRIMIGRMELILLLNGLTMSDVESTFPSLLVLIDSRQHRYPRDEFVLFKYQESRWVADTLLQNEQVSSMMSDPVCSGDVDNDGDQDICTPRYCFENIADDGSWIVHNYRNAGSEQLILVCDQNAEYEQRLIISEESLANLVCADIDGNGTEELIYISDYNIWFIDHFTSDRTGELLSEVLILNESTVWKSIDWSSDEPEGTYISFYVRFDDMNPMDWFGPINEPGSLLDYRESSSRTFQYKVVLESDHPDVTPVLNSVTATWE